MSHGLTTLAAKILLDLHGRNELTESHLSRWILLLSQFTGPMTILLWIAIVVEARLQSWLDVVILLALQFSNGSVGFYEKNKANNAIAALAANLKPSAQVN